jgi:sigma-B regulation protein RsbU (phosphoserine phosphatase)
VPLPLNVVAKLQREGRLPKTLTQELAINLPDLKQSLDTKQPYLTPRLAATGNNELSLLAIVRLQYKPWSVLFAQPIAVALAPVEKQIQDAVLLLAIIASIVTIIAVAIAQLLTQPVIDLTQAVAEFTAGHLDIRVKMRSPDEIGLLARSFNSMARQLQESFDIVSGCMGTIESRSIIPHSPTDDSRLPTDYHSGVTGIDMKPSKPKLKNEQQNSLMLIRKSLPSTKNSK